MLMAGGKPGRDWEAFAKSKGYKSLKAMLKDLYVKKDIRGRALAKVMVCSHIRTLQLLDQCGIKRKPQGGAFVRKGQFKLKSVPNDVIRETDAKELSKKFKVHITTARRMKRLLKVEDLKTAKEKTRAERKAAAPQGGDQLAQGSAGPTEDPTGSASAVPTGSENR
jgi:hypothetical protein